MTNKSSARLFVILAREAPVGVIFRRGPTKQVQLIKWDTTRDHFDYGQWLKARIYEHRCDLSPSGEKLIYCAATYKKPLKGWTAISKPPYLTALALWPNSMGWDGGGVFESENTIAGINEKTKPLAQGFSLPKNIMVKPLGSHNSFYMERLLRDGWTSHIKEVTGHLRNQVFWQKIQKKSALLMHLKGSFDIVEYSIRTQDGENPLNLGRLDWANWDKNGDLLFTKAGKLFRLKQKKGAYNLESAVELADFNNSKFEERVASKEALKW
jgi:hypothetical protein